MLPQVETQSRICVSCLIEVRDLVTFREATNSTTRPIMFVAHSLGGLVVQSALIYSLEQRGEEEAYLGQVEKCTHGLALLGVPNPGSDLTPWLRMGTRLAQCLSQRPNENIIRALEPGSEFIREVCTGFSTVLRIREMVHRQIRISCFYEELEVTGIGLVVEQKSAEMAGYSCIPIPANHTNMGKFAHERDIGYIRVKTPLSLWRDELAATSHVHTADNLPMTVVNSAVLPHSVRWDISENRRVSPALEPFIQLAGGISFFFRLGGFFAMYFDDDMAWSPRHRSSLPSGTEELRLQPDGNLVISIQDELVWEMGTHIQGAQILLFSSESPFLSLLDRNCRELWDLTRWQPQGPW